MEQLVPLTPFFNRFAETRTSAKKAQVLHAEIFHHANNGAAVLQGHVRRVGGNEREYINKAQDIAAKAGIVAHNVMETITPCLESLHLNMPPLIGLVLEPTYRTSENYQALDDFKNRIDHVSGNLKTIRLDAEIDLLRASGMITDTIDMMQVVNGIVMNDYYYSLLQVQLGVKVVQALSMAIPANIRAGKKAIEEFAREKGIKAEVLTEFEKAAQAVAAEVTVASLTLTHPLAYETQQLEISSTRLMTVVKDPARVNQESLDALGRFNGKIKEVITGLGAIRNDAEIRLLRASGLVPSDFKLV